MEEALSDLLIFTSVGLVTSSSRAAQEFLDYHSAVAFQIIGNFLKCLLIMFKTFKYVPAMKCERRKSKETQLRKDQQRLQLLMVAAQLIITSVWKPI